MSLHNLILATVLLALAVFVEASLLRCVAGSGEISADSNGD